MSDYTRTALSGWFAALLFSAGLALPHMLRRVKEARRPYLRRLWPHFWIGYLVPVVAFAHAWIPMSHGGTHGLNATGLWLATMALLLMIWQVGLGLTLQSPALSGRCTLRSTHFWTMALMAGLIVAHIALNRP